MSILGMILGKGPSGFGYDTTADEVLAGLDLKGKTVLVTGVTSGIGRETLRALCARGARVLALARTVEKAQGACALAQGTRAIGTTGTALPVACDLGEPASVREAVAQVARSGSALDAVIANAGIMALPTLQRLHGYEAQFFTNHVGHFLLVTGLLGQLAPQGRVVMVSSEAHRRAPPGGIELDNLTGERGYGAWRAYAQSKLANLLFAKQLATRLPAAQTAHAIHPGVIATNLGRHMNPAQWITFQVVGTPFLKSIAQGAATQCYVATHAAPGAARGQYYASCNVAQPTALGQDMALAAKLWEKTEQIVAGLR